MHIWKQGQQQVKKQQLLKTKLFNIPLKIWRCYNGNFIHTTVAREYGNQNGIT